MTKINHIAHSISNPMYDGIILSKEELLLSWDYLNHQNFSHYKSMEEFIKNKSDENSIVIVNVDNCTQINPAKSDWLFNKIRGKRKLML
jgi:hypothetical protein